MIVYREINLFCGVVWCGVVWCGEGGGVLLGGEALCFVSMPELVKKG
jgi:hypothetical protein